MTDPSPNPAESAGDEQRAWGWVSHLQAGGTTPWQDWHDGPDLQQGDRGLYLPGAQQLELLRRLNAAGTPGPGLAARVLAASAAGRGRPDLQLVGVGGETGFGPDPVDPAALPAGELVRVAASVLADELADDLARDPAADPGDTHAAAVMPSWWRRGYRLAGDPELADPLRAQLVHRGRPPGGRQPHVLVLGTDLATMTGHAWTARAFGEGAPSWREWLRALRERRELPARADLLAACRAWEQRVGKERVHVVLDASLVASLVRERRALTPPATLPGECAELARRVGAVLGLLVLPEARATLLTTRLRPRIEAAVSASGLGRLLVVPPAHRDWVEAAAQRMREEIERAGYAVHGDLDGLVPVWPSDRLPEHAGPSPDATLDLAVRVLLDGVDDRRTT